MRHFLTFLLLSTVAACAAPTAQTPTYTKAELTKEQQAQAEAAKMAGSAFDDQKKYSQDETADLAVRLGPIASRISSAAESLCRDMHAKGCSYKVILDENEVGLNAHADGQNVVINPAMVDFASNDNHLAFVIAHEFAHNLMGHLDAQKKNVAIGGIIGSLADYAAQSQGYSTGGSLGKLGAQQALLRYSPAFEHEADYVGLYILARAGYSIEEAPAFWRIMSNAEPRSIYVTSTHPNNPARTIEMEKAVTEINAKRAAGKPLLPNIAPKA